MAYQNAIQFWKEFDIQSLQKQLDDEASLVAKRQDESDVSVKKLVELSREFRRNSTEEIRKAVSPLLKAFQAEIDSLTRRSTATETTFLNTYRKFIEIPDPIPLFEQALFQQQKLMFLQDLELENKKLRETLEEYTNEFAHVKNQEATINKLRTQIRELENSIESKAAGKAADYENKLKESFKEKEKQLKESENTHKQKTNEVLANNALLQSALESTQSELFELKCKLDEEASARAAELDIIETDLERANQRATIAEKKLEKLQKSQVTVSETLSKLPIDSTELELELRAKDKELNSVREDVERLQKNLNALRESSSNQIKLLEEQLKDKDGRVIELEKQLSQREDYEEIKKELNILKTVEFSTSKSEVTLTSSKKPLEVLLLEKNRGLVNENTAMKTELSELRGHFTVVQSQYKDSLQIIQDQRLLISQLEEDLARIQPYLPPRTEGEGQASPSEIIAEAVKDIPPERGDSNGNNKESLLTIVTNQRERFKQRNIELESESQEQKQTISVLQREVDTLRGDNIKMYEKIRFLQTYPTKTRGGSNIDVSMSRYSNQYEAGLDPFAVFSAKERQRKYMQLSGPDKATLILGRFILSNRIIRMATFFYLVILHLIVILVLSQLANNTATSTVDLYTECAKKYTEHMSIFHAPQGLHSNNVHDPGGIPINTQ